MRGRNLAMILGLRPFRPPASPLDGVRSPFPGMDPYLESRWPAVHVPLAAYVVEQVQRSLPLALRARVREHVVSGHAVPYVDPLVVVVDTTDNFKLVTVVEVLQAPHKVPGDVHDEYRRRLRQYDEQGVNVVEIDLLRGPRIGMPVSRSELSPAKRTPYLICQRRATQLDRWACYAVPLRQPIPRVPLPLRPGDADGVLDLQPLVTRAYAAGRHDDLSYQRDPDPPLAADDARWADLLLRSAGRRV